MAVAVRGAHLSEQVYDEIRGRLLTRRYPAGAKLSLPGLAAELGVSRSPIHQALTRLVSEGLLTVRARRGYFVTPVTANALAEGYDVRLALELHAAVRAIDGLATPELLVFRSLLDATATTISHEEWDAANAAFLEYQIDLAGNTLLSRFYRELSVNLLMQVIRGGSRRRPCEHRHGARPYRRGLRSEGPRTSPQRDPGAHRDGTPDRARGDRARRRRPLDVLTTDV